MLVLEQNGRGCASRAAEVLSHLPKMPSDQWTLQLPIPFHALVSYVLFVKPGTMTRCLRGHQDGLQNLTDYPYLILARDPNAAELDRT